MIPEIFKGLTISSLRRLGIGSGELEAPRVDDYQTWKKLLAQKLSQAAVKKFPCRFVSSGGYFTISDFFVDGQNVMIAVWDYNPRFEGEVHREAVVLLDGNVHYLEYFEPETERPEKYWPNWQNSPTPAVLAGSFYISLKGSQIFDPRTPTKSVLKMLSDSGSPSDSEVHWRGRLIDSEAILLCIEQTDS